MIQPKVPFTGERISGQAVMQTISADVARSVEAAAIQRSFMPPSVYSGTFVDAAADSRPCGVVGGDFYDYMDTGGEFHVLLGDVCGNGTPAALQAALVQGILSVELGVRTGAASVVNNLNHLLCRHRVPQRFVTLFYGRMTRDRSLTYCNAGHCWPMLLKGSSVIRLSAGGVPPGLFDHASYEEESVTLEYGDTLVVFSDGVPEATAADQIFGDDRILLVLSRNRGAGAATVRDALMNALREFTGHRVQRDDVTVLVVRYLSQGGA